MARYDNNFKCMEVRRLADSRKYAKALETLEKIDINKIKNITDLNTFAEVYRKTENYDKAQEVLLRIYDKAPSRRVLYKLVSLYVKAGRIGEAENYYQEYANMAPDTSERYILRYRLDKAVQADYQTRIHSLEQLKKTDYMEEWAYELAKLYHKAGMEEECIRECSDIILWFGEGVIVEKARLLRAYYVEGADILGTIQQPGPYGEQESSLETEDQENPAGSAADEKKTANDRETDEKSLFMNTRDLGQQIAYISNLEKHEGLAKELQEDLKPTVNIQALMQAELGLNQPDMVEEEIVRLLREEEREPGEAAEAMETVEITGSMESAEAAEPAENQEGTAGSREEISEENLESNRKESEEQASKAPVFYAGGKEMSDIFKDFLEEPRMQEQLSELLNEIQNGNSAPHILITGEDDQRNAAMAKCLAKALRCMDKIPTSRVAKIQGSRLNGMNLTDKRDKLRDGTLLIEKARDLYVPTVKNIVDMIEDFGEHMVVILSDEHQALEILLEENYVLQEYFSYRIQL